MAAPKINAQEVFSWSKETGYCTPSVIGLPRPKAFIFQYELQPAFKITSTAKDGNFESTSGEISRNRRLDFRLRFPIINKPLITIQLLQLFIIILRTGISEALGPIYML